ncbi:MAG: alpha/beta hydrolase [Asticcacaulis sp.]
MKLKTRFARNLGTALATGLMTLSCVLAAPAMAADDKMTPIAIPAQPGALKLDTGTLPDAKNPESWHSQYGSVFARNVTDATLTPFLPDPSIATGAAVIVAPGGGFRTLSMENEGWDVAKALAARGVAAFVLKYRLNQTPADMAGFEKSMTQMFSSVARPPAPKPNAAPPSPAVTLAPQLADSRAAFALVRAHADEWHIDKDRIGMIGFSAGAMLTMSTELYANDTKPAFLGSIYGGLNAVDVPADAPPLFVALAADDPLMAHGKFGLIESWTAAKRPIEFHYYEQGGHGFGMYQKPTTSTMWFANFTAWLEMHGFIKPKS